MNFPEKFLTLCRTSKSNFEVFNHQTSYKPLIFEVKELKNAAIFLTNYAVLTLGETERMGITIWEITILNYGVGLCKKTSECVKPEFYPSSLEESFIMTERLTFLGDVKIEKIDEYAPQTKTQVPDSILSQQ